MNYREQMLLRTFVQQGVLCWGQVGACSEDGKGSMNGWLIWIIILGEWLI